MGDLHDKTTKVFSLAMHGIQVISMIVVVTLAYASVKSDIRDLNTRVESTNYNVARITEYLGIWTPKQKGINQ